MTEDSSPIREHRARPAVAFTTAAVGLLLLLIANIEFSFPALPLYLVAGYFITIMVLSVLRQGDKLDPEDLCYVVTRKYLDTDAKFVTRSRQDAIAYAISLLDGLAEFVRENPDSESTIIKKYSVSIKFPVQKNSHIAATLERIRKGVSNEIVEFLAERPHYKMTVTTKTHSSRDELIARIEEQADD